MPTLQSRRISRSESSMDWSSTKELLYRGLSRLALRLLSALVRADNIRWPIRSRQSAARPPEGLPPLSWVTWLMRRRADAASGPAWWVRSGSVVRMLIELDLVDEYRRLVFPIVLGGRSRRFLGPIGSIDPEVVSAERSGAAALVTYPRARAAR